jgi:replicative DNA helicase
MTTQSFPRTPCDVDAEKALLASFMLNNAKLPVISQKVRSQDFFIKSNQIIYQVMLEMNAKSIPIDLLTLSAWSRTLFLA